MARVYSLHQGCSGLISLTVSIEALHQLPLSEKLFVIEALWGDLSASGANLTVPQWHRELLDEREAEISSGKAKFIDCEDAKREILEAVK